MNRYRAEYVRPIGCFWTRIPAIVEAWSEDQARALARCKFAEYIEPGTQYWITVQRMESAL